MIIIVVVQGTLDKIGRRRTMMVIESEFHTSRNISKVSRLQFSDVFGHIPGHEGLGTLVIMEGLNMSIEGALGDVTPQGRDNMLGNEGTIKNNMDMVRKLNDTKPLANRIATPGK